jgi:hypothetical protein
MASGCTTPGEKFCLLPEAAPPVVVQCGIDLVNIEQVQTCEGGVGTPGMGCVSGACTNPCQPGMRLCVDNNNFQTCQSNSTWGPVERCGAGMICEPSGPSGTGVCWTAE